MSSRRNVKTAKRTARTDCRRSGDGAVGVLDVLSVGHGHMKVTITPGDDVELDKARKMIEDMLARGFSIFVEVADGSTRRVKRFDPKKMVYYIDPPDELAASPQPDGKARGTRRYSEVPVDRARATAVGRSAGG